MPTNHNYILRAEGTMDKYYLNTTPVYDITCHGQIVEIRPFLTNGWSVRLCFNRGQALNRKILQLEVMVKWRGNLRTIQKNRLGFYTGDQRIDAKEILISSLAR